MITIYALVDADSHLVRYVGQTTNVQKRYQIHCSGKDGNTGEWVRSLNAPPQLVLLETVSDCMARVPGTTGKHTTDFVKLGISTETKWLKRFRRTVINRKMRDNSQTTWDWLVNPVR